MSTDERNKARGGRNLRQNVKLGKHSDDWTELDDFGIFQSRVNNDRQLMIFFGNVKVIVFLPQYFVLLDPNHLFFRIRFSFLQIK